MAFDAEENFYVSDTRNHRIQKFTKDGKFILKWGGFGDNDGEFNMPWGLTVDELGDVYVADWRNDRIQKFSPDGEFICSLGKSGSSDGEFCRPTGVAVDAHGDIYVADAGNDRVQLFAEDGRYVEKFIGDASLSKMARDYMLTNAGPLRQREMSKLEPQKRFRTPRSVKLDDQFRMFVTDMRSMRVQVYQKDAEPLTPDLILSPPKSPSLVTN
jgi:DNA-binding beta-propeller fold protein YncE